MSRAVVRMLAGVVAALVSLCLSCSRDCADAPPPPAGSPQGEAVLSLRVDAPAFAGVTRAGGGEAMATLRVIILDSGGFAEHNALWDLRRHPSLLVTGQDFPVKANDRKTIILLANEHDAAICLPSGEVTDASGWFGGIDASSGQHVDVAMLRSITHRLADNSLPSGSLLTPMPITAIHTYEIGGAPAYSARFCIHRAAVKYTFSVTNADPSVAHTITSFSISNVSRLQYLFPDADFADSAQAFPLRYRTPAQTPFSAEFASGAVIPPGQTVSLPPVYLPEGIVAGAGSPYMAALSLDGVFAGWKPLYADGEAQTEPLTELQRNTHVLVNVTLGYGGFTLSYTVCPWVETETDIPPFG